MTLDHSLTGHDGMKQQTTIRRLGEIREDRTDWNRVVDQSEEDLIASIRADPDDEQLEDGWVERAIVVEQGLTATFPKTIQISVHWTRSHGQRPFAAWTVPLDDGKLFNLWLGRLGFEISLRRFRVKRRS